METGRFHEDVLGRQFVLAANAGLATALGLAEADPVGCAVPDLLETRGLAECLRQTGADPEAFTPRVSEPSLEAGERMRFPLSFEHGSRSSPIAVHAMV